MRKVLIFTAVLTSLALLQGCSRSSTLNITDPVSEHLKRSSLIFRYPVQQGNVVTQEMVNRLEPGMAREQVKFMLGTPMVQHTFHKDRWDYVYQYKPNAKPVETKTISLFFKNEKLARIEGDFRPGDDPGATATREVNVEVPDYVPEDRPLFYRVLDRVGVTGREDESK